MPCNSDHLEQSNREREIQRAAQLLVYLTKRLDRVPEKWMVETAGDYYANDKRVVPYLCALLKNLSSLQTDSIVYDARNSTSRRLADWMEEHRGVDEARVST